MISKLRKVLGPGVIDGRSSLRLRLGEDCPVDVEAATEAVHRAESRVALGDWKRAWGPSLVALFVAEREFLPGEDAAWIDDQRRQMKEVRIRALEAYAAATLGRAGPSSPQRCGRAASLSAWFRSGRAGTGSSCRRSLPRAMLPKHSSSTPICERSFAMSSEFRPARRRRPSTTNYFGPDRDRILASPVGSHVSERSSQLPVEDADSVPKFSGKRLDTNGFAPYVGPWESGPGGLI